MATSDVQEWAALVRSTRNSLGHSEQSYPDWFMLSFIDMSSAGDAALRRENPKQAGLFRMSEDQAAKVGTSVDSLADPETAIVAFISYMESFKTVHKYNPEYMALLWFTRVSVVEEYKAITESGDGPKAADEYLTNLWGGESFTRLQAFRSAFLRWSSGASMIPVRTGTMSSASTRRANCKRTSADRVSAGSDLAAKAAGVSSSVDAYTKYKATEIDAFRTSSSDPASTRAVTLLQAGSPDKTSITITLPAGSSLGFVYPMVEVDTSRGSTSLFATVRGRPAKGSKNADLPDGRRYHKGVDFYTSSNPTQPVYAVYDGVVLQSYVSASYGHAILIDHKNGFGSLYAHLSTRLIQEGATVTRGQVIANAGATEGRREGGTIVPTDTVETPHLHFEMRIHKTMVDDGVASTRADALTQPGHFYYADPMALLSGAASPDSVQLDFTPDIPPVSINIDAARSTAAELKSEATSTRSYTSASASYDMLSAMHRSEQLASAGRATFWAQAYANQQEVETRIVENTRIDNVGFKEK